MHRTAAAITAAGLAAGLAPEGFAAVAGNSGDADPLGRTTVAPSLAPQRGGYVYINAHTGERVISKEPAGVGRAAPRGAWLRYNSLE